MKYTRLYWLFMIGKTKKPLIELFGKKKSKVIINKAKLIYKDLIVNAPNMGKGNTMVGNMYGAMVFVSILIASDFQMSHEEFSKLIHDTLEQFKWILNKRDLSNDKNQNYYYDFMDRYKKWYDKQDHNEVVSWNVHVNRNLHTNGQYYEFTTCPIASYMKDLGLSEYTPCLCKMDYQMFEYQNANLIRKQTIAKEDPICDFWILPKNIDDAK